MKCLARVMLAVGAFSSFAVVPLAGADEELLNRYCLGCHMPSEQGLSRISEQRKTPEGWEMTISRMQLMHGLVITDQDGRSAANIKVAIVKHLADTQGLAPSETSAARYLPERLPAVQEAGIYPDHIQVTCGRCHSSARHALQRRSPEEWQKSIHFHLGQYPSIEYSLYGRDREWLDIAVEQIMPEIATQYPLQTQAWSDWQATEKQSLSGSWQLVGDMPGKGRFVGTMSVTQDGDDHYYANFSGEFDNGERFTSRGESVVYTGYEWRGSFNIDGVEYRQVLAANESFNTMQGRLFQADHSELGVNLSAVRDSGQSILSAVWPEQLKVGGSATLTLHCANLACAVALPDGITVRSVERSGPSEWRAVVEVAANADTGRFAVSHGSATLDSAVALFGQVNAVTVLPDYSVARVGGHGGSQNKMYGAFTAYAIDYGQDGAIGGGDDIELGAVPASWRVEPWDETARHDDDVKFAGSMDAVTGIFTPAAAGPNPERKQSTNNVGNLKVVATVNDGERVVEGSAHMIATVQRWNNPPLR